MPSVEMVRFVSSGTEAAMSAIRLARAATGRPRILKFDGCYHGHADALLVGAGSGVATLGIPGSPGVPESFAQLTVQAPFNDLAAVADALGRWRGEIACILVEPVAGNMDACRPSRASSKGSRRWREHGAADLRRGDDRALLAYGGAQQRYGITPDLTVLGKIVGGGLPAAAYGGRRELMEQIAPMGPVYQAGTLSGNPLAMAAGLETLRQLRAPGVYAALEARARTLAEGLAEAAREGGVELSTAAVGGMFGFFIHPGPVRDFAEARKADAGAFRVFFHAMLDQGFYFAPSAYEAGFVSLAHRPADVAATLAASRTAFKKAARAH
jgi:glutamate-1-semialdehyde 2,1-aminomutase